MGTYKTYFDKNTTIIKNSEVNTGRNPVSELYFGEQTSRFLIYCSFSELLGKIQRKDIILDSNVKHYLKIKNTTNYDVTKVMSEDHNLTFQDNYHSSSFDLELKIMKEFWDEGSGYDFIQTQSNIYNRDFSKEPANWFNGTYNAPFLIKGGMLSNTAVGTQHFDQGNENVSIEITNIVNEILVSGVTSEVVVISGATGTTYSYQGFCLKYTDQYESLTFGDKRISAFGLFTKYTQTFFEPYIETVYDDYICDDRVNFHLNKTNKLFLYINVDGEMTNSDTLPTCKINGTFYTVTQKSRGIYYVSIFANSTIFDSYTEYRDIWAGIVINGVTRPSVSLKFFPKEDVDYYQTGSQILESVRYGISLSGIKNEEKLTQGEMRKVIVHVRKPYTVEQNDVIISKLYYRMYIKQGPNQVEVIPWSPVNQIYNTNSFTIDTVCLVPQIYYVDIKVQRNGEINLYDNELKFSIINKYE